MNTDSLNVGEDDHDNNGDEAELTVDPQLSELLAFTPVLLRAQSRRVVAEAVASAVFKIVPNLNFSSLLLIDELTDQQLFIVGRKNPALEAYEDSSLLAKLPSTFFDQLEQPRLLGPKQLDEPIQNLLDSSLLYIVPTRTPNHRLGYLIAGGRQRFSVLDRQYLRALAELTAIALIDAQRFEDLKDAFDDMSLVNEMAVSLAASLNSEELFQTFINGLGELVAVDRAILAQVSYQNQMYHPTFVWNAPPDLARRSQLKDLPLVGSPLEEAVTRQEIIIGKWQTDPAQGDFTVFDEQFQSQIIIPLVTKKRLIGTLALGTRRASSYEEDYLRRSLLEKLAALFAQALFNSLRYEEKQMSAEFDNPTGVYNRNYFDRELPAQLHRASHEGYRLGLIMIDMDNLKAINDQYLHTTGDAALRHLANLIRHTVREADVVARYGGDEFSVILPRCTPFGLEVVAEKAWRAIRNTPLVLEGGKEIRLSVSVGAAIYPEDAISARDLLTQADAALFVAKRQRDQVRIGPDARLPGTLETDSNQVELSVEANVPITSVNVELERLSQWSTEDQPDKESAVVDDLYRQLENSSQQLLENMRQAAHWEKGLWESLRLVAHLVELREPYLSGEAEKLVRLVQLLAAQFNLSQLESNTIQAAAWLLNLGRLSLPEALCNSSGPLSAQDWTLIQHCPIEAADLASMLETHLPPGTLVALRHPREHFDGTGYPFQLADENIPFAARLLGVSSALVAMSQSRPYRPALDRASCRHALEQDIHRKFDPTLTSTLLYLLDKGSLDFLNFG